MNESHHWDLRIEQLWAHGVVTDLQDQRQCTLTSVARPSSMRKADAYLCLRISRSRSKTGSLRNNRSRIGDLAYIVSSES